MQWQAQCIRDMDVAIADGVCNDRMGLHSARARVSTHGVQWTLAANWFSLTQEALTKIETS